MFTSLVTHDDEELRFRQERGTQIFVIQTPHRNSAAEYFLFAPTLVYRDEYPR